MTLTRLTRISLPFSAAGLPAVVRDVSVPTGPTSPFLNHRVRPQTSDASGTSRSHARCFPYVHGVSDRAGSGALVISVHGWCLPLLLTPSASRSKQLSAAEYPAIGSPCQRCVAALREAPHDSWQMWVASLYRDFFIHCTSPVCSGAQGGLHDLHRRTCASCVAETSKQCFD